jgi:hypothetical protein
VVSALDPVLKFLGRTILATPRLDRQERVRELWRFSLVIANAALILFVLTGAGVVMVGGLSSQLTLKELLPRVFFAALTVNFGLILTGELISVANGLSLAVLGAAADPSDISGQIAERIYGAGMASPLFLLFALVVLILAVLVIVAYIVRVAALVVLLAGGPLFLVTHSLPQTDQVARTWWRLVAAMIASPVLQAFVLTAAVKVFLTGDGVLGLTRGGFVDLLIIGCLLYLLYRIPLLTIKVALRGAGSRAWSASRRRLSRLPNRLLPWRRDGLRIGGAEPGVDRYEFSYKITSWFDPKLQPEQNESVAMTLRTTSPSGLRRTRTSLSSWRQRPNASASYRNWRMPGEPQASLRLTWRLG